MKGGDITCQGNMEDLYASIRSQGMEEEYDIRFPDWKGVDDYQDFVEPTSLSANFAAVFSDLLSLINPRVECTVIFNGITQDNNKVPEDNINETIKFHRLERIMEKAVSTVQSVVEAE